MVRGAYSCLFVYTLNLTLVDWSIQNFEKAYMVPAESNKALAEYTFTYFGRASTEKFGVRKFMRSLITCFLDERVRIAMMLVGSSRRPSLINLLLNHFCVQSLILRNSPYRQPEQPAYMHRIVNLIVAWYRFKFRYLALPRFKPKMYSDRDVKEEKLQGPCPRAVPNKCIQSIPFERSTTHRHMCDFTGSARNRGTNPSPRASHSSCKTSESSLVCSILSFYLGRSIRAKGSDWRSVGH